MEYAPDGIHDSVRQLSEGQNRSHRLKRKPQHYEDYLIGDLDLTNVENL